MIVYLLGSYVTKSFYILTNRNYGIYKPSGHLVHQQLKTPFKTVTFTYQGSFIYPSLYQYTFLAYYDLRTVEIHSFNFTTR